MGAQGLGVLLEHPDLVLRGGQVLGRHMAAEAGEAALDVVDAAVHGAQPDVDELHAERTSRRWSCR